MNNLMKIKCLMLLSMIALLGLIQVVNAGQKNHAKHKAHKNHKDYTFISNESISKTMQFSDQGSTENHLTIFNVYGSIDVVAYAGSEVLIEADNKVFGKTEELLQTGLDEIGLKFEQQDQSMRVYLDSPYTYIDRDSGKIWHSDTCWRHNDCSRKHVKKAYRYHMNITVKVPMNTSLKVSTINQGDIKITGLMANSISANNINGAITMHDVAAQIDAYAINQDIDITYRNNPTADSSYESINGDLNLTFASEPNFEAAYKTTNGEFYSSFDVSTMSPKVERTVEQNKHGIQYKLDASSRLLVGTGGPELKFKTLNGDIKIQGQ